jgi:hypothetical protein
VPITQWKSPQEGTYIKQPLSMQHKPPPALRFSYQPPLPLMPPRPPLPSPPQFDSITSYRQQPYSNTTPTHLQQPINSSLLPQAYQSYDSVNGEDTVGTYSIGSSSVDAANKRMRI